jgi:hypothetical protein
VNGEISTTKVPAGGSSARASRALSEDSESNDTPLGHPERITGRSTASGAGVFLREGLAVRGEGFEVATKKVSDLDRAATG